VSVSGQIPLSAKELASASRRLSARVGLTTWRGLEVLFKNAGKYKTLFDTCIEA
jgi:hypothetical protein